MAEGPNEWEWQVGLATHEGNAADDPVLTGRGTRRPGRNPGQRLPRRRTLRGEASTRKPGFDGTINEGGVRSRESRKSVETRSPEQGQSRRRWDDHWRRQGLPACVLARH